MGMGGFVVTVMIVGFIAVIAIMVIMQDAASNNLKGQLDSLTDFKSSASYVSALSKNSIAIDVEGRKIAIARTGFQALEQAKRMVEETGHNGNKIEAIQHRMKPVVLGFDAIVAAELIRDNTSIHKTNRGSQIAGAAVGGVLFGAAGLIVGGLSGSSRQESKIERLALRIYTNDLICPVHDMTFVYAPDGLDVHTLKEMIQAAELWYGRLRSILEMRSAEAASIK